MKKKIEGRLSFAVGENINFSLSENEEGETQKTFSMLAYSGAGIFKPNIAGNAPIYIDVAGLAWTEKSRPILLEHDVEKRIGYTTAISAINGALYVDGVMLEHSTQAGSVASDAIDGFPWQASVGVSIGAARSLNSGEFARVNERDVEGPAYIVERGELYEISFVALGADDNTSVDVSASADANFLDLEMDKMDEEVLDLTAARVAEHKRIAAVEAACEGNAMLCAQALEQGWSVEAAQSAVKDLHIAQLEEKIRSSANVAAPAIIATKSVIGLEFGAALEAAAMKSAGLRDDTIIGACGEQALEAARQHRGVGLKGLVLQAAAHAGHYSASVDNHTIRAAFSTASLPGILSNIANKSLFEGYAAQPSAVDIISAAAAVNDFKLHTQYALNVGGNYSVVAPGEELPHGNLTKGSRSHSAQTRGMMLTVDRQMIVNDDLGALAQIAGQAGRIASNAKEKIGMAKFMETTNFWAAGNGNYVTGTATALSIASLSAAEANLLNKVDANGEPINTMGRLLVVPPALYATAQQLMMSMGVTGGSTAGPDVNPHAGKWQVVTSPYLSAATITGYSSAAWYLIADPAVLPVLVMSYLNGERSPIIEEVELPADRLGIGFRVYSDFGADKGDTRGGVKMLGADA